jgi:hypothetical protein
MTHKNKELLLKDISARLPYGICFYFEKMHGIFHLSSIKEDHMFPSNDFDVLLNDKFPIQWCKPYLRPMSSMTEEEKEELSHLLPKDWSVDVDKFNNFYFNMCSSIFIEIDILLHIIDWINAHHFDYRGLIEKCLAIEAPEGMYTNN